MNILTHIDRMLNERKWAIPTTFQTRVHEWMTYHEERSWSARKYFGFFCFSFHWTVA